MANFNLLIALTKEISSEKLSFEISYSPTCSLPIRVYVFRGSDCINSGRFEEGEIRLVMRWMKQQHEKLI